MNYNHAQFPTRYYCHLLKTTNSVFNNIMIVRVSVWFVFTIAIYRIRRTICPWLIFICVAIYRVRTIWRWFLKQLNINRCKLATKCSPRVMTRELLAWGRGLPGIKLGPALIYKKYLTPHSFFGFRMNTTQTVTATSIASFKKRLNATNFSLYLHG